MAGDLRARAAVAPAVDARNNPERPEQGPRFAVRMYRQGLGDCFLLTFPRDGPALYMLIDCGVLFGTEDQDERMQRGRGEYRRDDRGHIDILVATHEHWDHLSGFVQAGGSLRPYRGRRSLVGLDRGPG